MFPISGCVTVEIGTLYVGIDTSDGSFGVTYATRVVSDRGVSADEWCTLSYFDSNEST